MKLRGKDLFELSYRIAGEAAGLLRDYREEGGSIEKINLEKETLKADKASEDYIIDALRKEGFKGEIVTEETGFIKGRGDVVALIDPLDGSRNYFHRIPWCSVSIAFARKRDREINFIAGIVKPVYDAEAIGFYKGGGLFHGKRKVKNKRIIEMNNREPLYTVYEDNPEALMILESVFEEKRKKVKPKVRSLGSAALELAYTALGKFAAFIDVRSKLRIFDVAAGIGLIEEAGGYYMDVNGCKPELNINRIESVGSIMASLNKEELMDVVNAYSKYRERKI